MAFTLKDGQGSFGANRRKREGSNDADISGKFMLDGKMYYINGWRKVSQNDGSIWYSLSIKPAQPRTDSQPDPQPQRTSQEAAPDDCPF